MAAERSEALWLANETASARNAGPSAKAAAAGYQIIHVAGSMEFGI
jgi:hypothetical protein